MVCTLFSSESIVMLAARAKSSSTSLALTYPSPSGAAMKARRLGQSFITCPMPLQRWQTMLVVLLEETPGATLFCGSWGCTEDKVLTLKAFVVAIGVASGLATVALGLSKSERCGKDLPMGDLNDCW